MFLRSNRRKKDGKVHEYWSIVENRRLHDGRVVQRQLLYLGEISASQHDAWRRSIEIDDAGARRQVALFATERLSASEVDSIGVRLSGLRLERPRQWGACWLALELWQQLELDSFWRPRLRPSREGTPWLKVLKTLVCYRLIDPGSEWRLHRQWFDASAMADLLESDFALAAKDTLYRCLDRLLAHKDDLFKFLVRRWGELFQARFDVLLYDLTSTYFETDEPRGPQDLRQFGYSRDKRGDCRQVVIALIVTPEGLPLSYEVMRGNTVDNSTLSGFLHRIEQRYGRANRIWVMDRGIPTEASLAQMRIMGASYLVGTPKGRLTRLEQSLLEQPWATVREGLRVKRLGVEQDVYVLAESAARVHKERAMRRKRLGRYVQRLHALQAQTHTRDKLLMKLGAARHDAGRVASAIKVTVPEPVQDATTATVGFEFRLDRARLRRIRRREARYVLRTNLAAEPPERLWSFYIQLTEVEQAFKEVKHDLAIRPIFHKVEPRIEAHIFVAFLAYCVQVTLKARLKPHASGLTARQALDKFSAVQMVDVHIPTHDHREVILTRYTQPDAELRMLLEKLGMTLPPQPPPRITAAQLPTGTDHHPEAATV
jgi:transposase